MLFSRHVLPFRFVFIFHVKKIAICLYFNADRCHVTVVNKFEKWIISLLNAIIIDFTVYKTFVHKYGVYMKLIRNMLSTQPINNWKIDILWFDRLTGLMPIGEFTSFLSKHWSSHYLWVPTTLHFPLLR